MSRIDNFRISQQLGQTDATLAAARAPARSDVAAPPQPDPVAHTPAPEVQQALSLLRQVPEVRQDVVQQVALQLNTGTFLTDSAARQTANAILNALQPEPLPAVAQEIVAQAVTARSSAASTPPSADPTAAAAPAGNTDLNQLLDTLRQIPVLRQEVVSEVAQRLSNGQLFTPAARDNTVKAILESTGQTT